MCALSSRPRFVGLGFRMCAKSCTVLTHNTSLASGWTVSSTGAVVHFPINGSPSTFALASGRYQLISKTFCCCVQIHKRLELLLASGWDSSQWRQTCSQSWLMAWTNASFESHACVREPRSFFNDYFVPRYMSWGFGPMALQLT